MSLTHTGVPIGVSFLNKVTDLCCPRLHFNRQWCYQSSVLFLTYMAYMCYHLSRKPISVVKIVLHYDNCTGLTPSNGSFVPSPNDTTWCDWAPFDGPDANALLGVLDSCFLFAYAAAMFVSGFVAERVNLRYFLSLGMLFSGVASYLFGIAKSYNIHIFTYFMIVQIFGGICQTTGWPGVVTVVGNWFGKSKRGLIFGIWNSHTSLGNIFGTLIASKYVETDWSNSFIVPALVMGSAGFVLFLFLVTNPVDVGLPAPDNGPKRLEAREPQVSNIEAATAENSETDETEILIGEQDAIRYRNAESEVQRRMTERSHLLINQSSPEERAIGFVGACKIPGVIEYSLSLFFSKLVSYTFLFWLPKYLSSSNATMGAKLSADLSTLFDVGGIAGAIVAGLISDYSGMSASTCVGMLLMAAPMMFIYQQFCTISLGVNMFLLLIVGFLVNGPYSLITTAVSAELGTHSSLDGNSKALATVTAIIDGTGSIGAAVGPLLAGLLSTPDGEKVFYMLIISDILALMLLLRLVHNEFHVSRAKFKHRRQVRVE